MIKFLLAYLLIYGAVHAVFFHRLRISFSLKGWGAVAITLFLILLVLAPMFSRILEAREHDAAARVVAHIGYYWMGFIFYAFLGCLCLYLIDFLLGVLSLFHLTFPMSFKKIQMYGLTALVLAVMVYGYFEASNIKVERIDLTTDKLPPHVQHLRVVQISDIHLGIINREKILRRIVRLVEGESPDMFVCTGDLVDGSMTNLMHLADLLKKIEAPFGKFAITGNHEYYAGLDHAMKFTQKAGFDILRQEFKTVKNTINVAGVDDGGRYEKNNALKPLSAIDNDLFTLYLVHKPDIAINIQGLYDLQLCGHTHNGQIYPFNYLVRLQFPLLQGMYKFEKGSRLYVNRGTGTWGPPLRVFSPPEITVFEIAKK